MKVQLKAGHRHLLDLLQRKLLENVELYARLASSRGQQSNELGTRNNSDESDAIEVRLRLLKEKMKRISARQNYFTKQIMHGNANNTISKETYLNALGLVTKEASHKLNTRPVERRRRTTANPRFSHEAIQAKKALEPYLKRLEPRVRREMILYN